ncbi:beta-microseminoprotein-like [Pelodytes ibericus]
MMKCVVAALVAVGILVTTCNAACARQRISNSNELPHETPKGCIYKGQLHDFGTHWRTEDCLDCSCSFDMMECCTAYGRPVSYDRKTCFALFDKKACSYSVLKKKDPSQWCDAYAMVG